MPKQRHEGHVLQQCPCHLGACMCTHRCAQPHTPSFSARILGSFLLCTPIPTDMEGPFPQCVHTYSHTHLHSAFCADLSLVCFFFYLKYLEHAYLESFLFLGECMGCLCGGQESCFLVGCMLIYRLLILHRGGSHRGTPMCPGWGTSPAEPLSFHSASPYVVLHWVLCEFLSSGFLLGAT
jgi:hypothetical protein